MAFEKQDSLNDRAGSYSPRRDSKKVKKKCSNAQDVTLGERQITPTQGSHEVSQASIKIKSALELHQPAPKGRNVSNRGLQARYSSSNDCPETNMSLNLYENRKKESFVLHDSDRGKSKGGLSKAGRHVESTKSVHIPLVDKDKDETPRALAPNASANLFQF